MQSIYAPIAGDNYTTFNYSYDPHYEKQVILCFAFLMKTEIPQV